VFTASAAREQQVPTSTPDVSTSTQDTPKAKKRSSRLSLSFLPDGVREGLPGAVRAIAVPTIAGCGLMLVILGAGASAILYVNELMETSARASWLPALAASIFGIAYGFSIGHCLSEKAGFVSWPGCVVGLAAVAVLLIAAYAGGAIFLGMPLPAIIKLCLVCVVFFSVLGVSYYTLWTQ